MGGSLRLTTRLIGASVVGVAALTFLGTPAAQADSFRFGVGSYGHHTSWSFGVRLGDPYYPRYYYRPYYAPPPVVVYSPPVVYSQPPVVYTTPPPVVYTAPTTTSVVTSPTPLPPPVTVINNPPAAPAPAPAVSAAPPAVYAPAQPAAPATSPYIPPAASDGWGLLSQNQPSAAHEMFTRQVQQDSLDASAKVGLAISRALLGDTGGAVMWMRRAVSVDPAALQRVRVDQPLRDQVQSLLVTYNAKVAEPATRADALFMLGALNTIVGDYAHAGTALQDAMQSGDTQPTTVNLRRLIEHELDRAPAH